ncbi:tRNA pseudouridine synthase A [Demequina aurantiaca]|uniref:tRNA pseudouridine synthase A n=1 Tax=Demequina aurantiaca TaxID=676200 RepID=UPI000786264A|nr:tRNA pseudouridine synthase A [Demequina aurantiaca]
MTELDSSDVVRVRLDFSYDGGDFQGWAAQPELRTVQGVMEAGLTQVIRRVGAIRLTVAGRTDAGVHARNQVAHFDLPREAWERCVNRSVKDPALALRFKLWSVLPMDIVVKRVSLAQPGFDARFSAIARRYTYRISDRFETRDPLRRGHVLWNRKALDIDALNAGALTVTGLRDFAPYCRPREFATTIRELHRFSWERPASGPDEGLVVATLEADAFCHSMVRSLVGAVKDVGSGRRDLVWLASHDNFSERSPGIAVVPPHGLVLEHVEYPDAAEMAARAQLTRRRRQANDAADVPAE